MSARTSKGARWIVAVAGLCAVSLAAAACSGGTDAADPSAGPTKLSEVFLNIGDINNIQKLVFAESGALEGTPYEVHMVQFSSGPSEFSALQNGTLDLGFAGDTAAIFAYGGGLNFHVIAALPSRPQNNGIVVPAGSSISSLADLEGKQVAVAFGTSGDYLLNQALDSAGLTVHDVTRKNLTPQLAMAALNSGSVDAAVLQQPFIALQQGGGAVQLTDGEGLMKGHAFSVASTGALDNDVDRQAITDYLSRLSKAFAWADKHPEKWAQAVADQYQIPVDIAATLSKNFGSLLAPIDDDTIRTTQVQADTFHDLKELPTEVDVSGMFDDSFADVLEKLNARGAGS